MSSTLARTGDALRIIDNQELDTTEPLWRYFKTERFLQLLESSHLYFAAARQFEDPFEDAVAVLPPGFPVDPRYAGLCYSCSRGQGLQSHYDGADC